MKEFLKKTINKIFNTCGLEINRVRSRRTTLASVLDHVSRLGFTPLTIIDVGVANGTFDLYERYPEANILLIEPLEEFEEDLRAISRKYRAEYVLAAAGAKEGKTDINVHPDLVGSSLFKEIEGAHVDGFTREVPVVTIDDLCSKRNLRGPYLIKVDVQGAECSVLDGAGKALDDAELIILEASLFQPFRNGPQFYDVIAYMKKAGFAVYDIFGGHVRPLDNALAQVDMAFVKENSRFRKDHFYALRKQREKLTKKLRPIL